MRLNEKILFQQFVARIISSKTQNALLERLSHLKEGNFIWKVKSSISEIWLHCMVQTPPKVTKGKREIPTIR